MDAFLLELLEDLQTLHLATVGYLIVNSMDSDAVLEHYNSIWEEELGAKLEAVQRAGFLSITSLLFAGQVLVYIYHIWRSSKERTDGNGDRARTRPAIAGITATREAWLNNQSWCVLTTFFDSVSINHLILNLSTTIMACGTVEGQFGHQTTFDLLLASAITCHVYMLWIRGKSPRGSSLVLLSFVGFMARALTLSDTVMFEDVVDELNIYLEPVKVSFMLVRVSFALLEILVSLLSILPYLFLTHSSSGYSDYETSTHLLAFLFGYIFKDFI